MKNQIFRKKLNDDGTPYIDPITNDFVSELVYEEIIVIPLHVLILEKIEEIDSNTRKLISSGFEYNGLTFSLSENAQINWSNIPNIPEAIFPLLISSKFDEPYQLQFAEKMNFYLSAVNGKNIHLQSGNALKQQVLALTEEAEILAFQDTRMNNRAARQSKEKIDHIKEIVEQNIKKKKKSWFKRIVLFFKKLFGLD